MRLFTAENLCVSVEEIDFLNPNALEDGRECGVRVELRAIEPDTGPGTIYVSRGLGIGRGMCRFDLLESAPRAQDRMHWHPSMVDGDPHDRVFDSGIRTDPIGFLGERLRDAVALLKHCGVEDADRFASGAAALAGITDAILADVSATLEKIRSQPWPPVEQRDERGMPVAVTAG